ncbi:creatininase family protein [Streptomyces uncialis]|uniref:creatininase family protein n=1 Tax=Streptomyces uncialis TaxID=1048205 RepID=UPI0033C98C30
MRQRATHVPRYGDLTSPEVPDRVRGATLVWPVGGLEQHGPHLPLSVDMDIPDALARQLAAETGGLVLPGQPLSARSLPHSGGGLHFPGTVHIGGAAFIDYLTEALRSLARLRPARLVVVNGHYENEGLLFEALDGCAPGTLFPATEVVAFSWWSLVTDGWLGEHLPAFPGWHAEHAGVTETSLMMYLRPDVVRPERPVNPSPPAAGVYRHPVDEAAISHQGVLSSTTGASSELGESLFWHLVDGGLRTLEKPSVPAPGGP